MITKSPNPIGVRVLFSFYSHPKLKLKPLRGRPYTSDMLLELVPHQFLSTVQSQVRVTQHTASLCIIVHQV